MLNTLNLAGRVSPLLLYLMVLGVLKHVMLYLFFWHGITNSPKSKVLCDLYVRLRFILIQSNAKAILTRSELCPRSGV